MARVCCCCGVELIDSVVAARITDEDIVVFYCADCEPDD